MPKRPSSIDKAPLRPHTYIIRRDTLSAIATRVTDARRAVALDGEQAMSTVSVIGIT